ncbi:LysR family transcriptional regulator [Sphingomonas oleivorans]|uniref:LysR family transcriptional regulator n=1 Tax=Sphingomonas oleivorans TaxID=1735121 RepID=A0A2T5FZ49_9SPHN|nr:LysR family transcriptional regulator [Sphingomonas oleivorans]PTQ11869.1 LysR family transcriptional regulator [Sphingomonas oleivorans]
MKRNLERTTGLFAFVRTVEAGSFSAAARLAGTTPSAVSKNVERLERRLGVKLFLRSTRSLSLTVEGMAYHERVAPLLRALEDADEVLAGAGQAYGLLKATIPGILGPTLIDALTSAFVARYPEIKLEISISDRHVDLVREGYDVALRAGGSGEGDWIARPLGCLPLVLVASPTYLDRAGQPGSIAELGRGAHIRYLLGARAYPIRFANGETLIPDGVFDTDSGLAMRTAALNGVGIAQLLRIAVEPDLQSGRLVEVMPQEPLAPVPMTALHAFGRVAPLRVRLFTDFIAETLAARDLKR